MKEYGIPEEGPPETTTPPDYTRPPRETFRPLHHTSMNMITISRPTWASTAYEKAFDTKEPTKNIYAPKQFTRSYAAVTSNDKQTKTPKKQSKKLQPEPTEQTTPTVPSTAPKGPALREPSTLMLQSNLKRTATIISPIQQTATPPQEPSGSFVKNTEQKFLDISRELMEICMERKTDKISAQMQDLMKSTSKIIARLGDPEEAVPPTKQTLSEVKKQGADDDRYLTDRDLKKFRKKVENVLDDTFHSFRNEIAAKLTSIEMRINSRLDDLVGPQNSQEESDDSDIEMEDDEGLERDESQEPPGSSTNTAISLDSETATGQSPQKKQKGDQGSKGK